MPTTKPLLETSQVWRDVVCYESIVDFLAFLHSPFLIPRTGCVRILLEKAINRSIVMAGTYVRDSSQ